MEENRREFLKKAMQGIGACCLLVHGPHVAGAGTGEEVLTDIDGYIEAVSKNLTFCAYRCSKECPWLMASLKNDKVKMREYADAWSRAHNADPLPDESIFCFGCKPDDKPVGGMVASCSVRACAMEKKFESCIECPDLAGCDKELWKKYPKHRENVLKVQQKGKGEKQD